MEKVKKLVRAGSSIPGAIRECLPGSLRSLALKHGRNYRNLASTMKGKKAPSDAEVAFFIAEIGGTDQEWRELLFEAGRPAARSA